MTERQKQLDRCIDPAGIRLENTGECLRKVMAAIGAHDQEAAFVLSRIQLRLRTEQVLEETDSLIARIEGTLDEFERDDRQTDRILKSMGMKRPF